METWHSGNADESKILCPRCGNPLPIADINVAADAALCRQCGTAYEYSELVHGCSAVLDVSNPPQGVSFEAAPGGFVASATTRSAKAWFLIPFMLVWSGVSLSGIYGTQFREGRFDPRSSLFGIPFLLGTLIVGSYALMCACGRVTVRRDADMGSVFEGIGPVGWTRRFRWTGVQSVFEGEASYYTRGGSRPRFIALQFKPGTESDSTLGALLPAGRPGRRSTMAFGTMLSQERRRFLMALLRSQISGR